MGNRKKVRKASGQFYAALNRMANGDAKPLADIWKHSETVTAMHPIGGRQVGWKAVQSSFERVARLASEGTIELRDQLIQLAGDVAYEAGIEHGQIKLDGEQVTIEQRVTNIYRRKDGAWKMTHHHVDASPAMVDVLGRLQSSPKAGE
jgi:ketosteroid isomerase-like protein